MSGNSQKFIARNRAPRVQIEYDVELYGSQKSVQLPFVMGVMSDLAGKSRIAQPDPDDRRFVEIDLENFDDRMRAMAPRAAFRVPNTLTGEGNLEVDLTFEKMADFTPAEIARKVPALRALLDARTQLSALMAYMDGKASAETLIGKILHSPSLLAALTRQAPDDTDHDAALAALRALAPAEPPETEDSDGVLDRLRDGEPRKAARTDRTDHVLAGLARNAPQPDAAPDPDEAVLAALSATPPAEIPAEDAAERALASLAGPAPDPIAEDRTGDVLSDLAAAAPGEPDMRDEPDDILSDLGRIPVADEAAGEDMDAVLADIAPPASTRTGPEDRTDAALESLASAAPPEEPAGDDIDDLLGSLAMDIAEEVDPDTSTDAALDSLAAATPPEDPAGDDLDDLLGSLTADTPTEVEPDNSTDTALDSLAAATPPEDPAGDDLDDLLADLVAESGEDPGEDALDALLADLPDGETDRDPGADPETGPPSDGTDGVDGAHSDGAMADTGTQPEDDGTATASAAPQFAFGTLSAERPAPQRLDRKRFRLAILGDFSGRAARGQVETGAALAARQPVLLDPDTAEEVIEGFATDLTLPIGKDGTNVTLRLDGLDDLHPDALLENMDLFAELNGLRGQLSAGGTADRAAEKLRGWGEKHGRPVHPPRSKSAGNAVPADLKLSAFQKLIGDRDGSLSQPSPVEDLIARVVGPHVRALPDTEMVQAVDAAISSAMRLILHHPEFQSIEAQWRAIDLIARSIETDDTLEVMLHDISAEEIAADLAAAEDLSQSGFARLLTEAPMDEETGRGAYSALIGLYTFEETPPHAELLGRIGRVAAHVDAPFLAAISPAFLDVADEDRHPLVARAWDMLREMPEAGYLGLLSPRFLLRRPYGAKSEPVHEFDFEEFTLAEGMKGMLWANPAVLAAILLARSFRRNGASMDLGSVMSLGGMPFHYVTDRYGDQVALPCTERNLTLDKIEAAVRRGYMAVASVKGRDEVRLTSFQSLAGAEILGPWSGRAPPPPSPPRPGTVAETDPGGEDFEDLDDLLADFGDDVDIGEDIPDSGDDETGDIDAELAALLEDL